MINQVVKGPNRRLLTYVGKFFGLIFTFYMHVPFFLLDQNFQSPVNPCKSSIVAKSLVQIPKVA